MLLLMYVTYYKQNILLPIHLLPYIILINDNSSKLDFTV